MIVANVVNDFLPKSEKYLFTGRRKESRMADFGGNFFKSSGLPPDDYGTRSRGGRPREVDLSLGPHLTLQGTKKAVIGTY